MAGPGKKRASREQANTSNSRSAETHPSPLPPARYSTSVQSSPVPGVPSPVSARLTPAPPSVRGSTPISVGHSSSGIPSMGGKYDGNRSDAPRSRSASPAPGHVDRGPSRVDPRNIDLGAGAWASIHQMSSSNLPARPQNLNTNGQEVSIALNSYKVLSYPSKAVHQYDIMIIPHGDTKVDPEGVKRIVLAKVWKSQAVQSQLGPGWVYDGNKLAWCFKKVDQIRVVVDLDKERDPTKESKGRNQFKFQLRHSTEVSFTTLNNYLQGSSAWDDRCLEAIAFLDHLMRETPRNKFFSFRRSFFSKNNDKVTLGGGVEALKGVYASMRCAYFGPGIPRSLSVNVDVANGTFWVEDRLLHAMMNTCGINDKGSFQRQFQTAASRDWKRSPLYDNLKRLQRVKVFTTHRDGHRDDYVIEKFLPQTAAEYSFMRDDTRTTIQDYYRREYRINPELGLPVVMMTRKTGKPGEKSNVVVPTDVLRISADQRYAYKLSDSQTSSMIKFAVTLPNERMRAIQAGVSSLAWAQDPYLTNYGVKIDTKPTQVKGRVLPPPDVQFANGPIPGTQAGQGRWRIDGKKFSTPNSQPLQAWGVCVIQDSREAPDQASTKAFFKNFVSIYKQHGGLFASDGPPVIVPGSLQKGGEMITDVWNATGNQFKRRPEILFFVMPKKDTVLYRMIKKSCDIRYGVVSQCLQARHVKLNQGQYISNVCLKVNAKLGGSTSKAGSKLLPKLAPKAASTPTMIIGVDVSHPAPGIMDQGSMAAITMSMNRDLNRYAAHVQTNGRRVELVMEHVWQEMEPMFGFWLKTVGGGKLPQRLIYLRDGLSEGQYQQCLETEVGYLRALLNKVQPGNGTKLTVIICSKRHHIRFFPTNPASGDRNSNPKPGTLIETGVTHPFEHDFYLCSHAAIKGTARPVHYHVLKNECEMSPAEIHQTMYESSYTYARATTPVSLPPAVYYAHLAASRAIAHINQPHVSSGKKEEGQKKQQATSSSSQTSLADIAPLMPMNNQASIKAAMWYI